MGISKKKNSFYYKFMIAGKLFCGKCEGCTTEREAKAFEQKRKEELKNENESVNPIEYHRNRITEIKGSENIEIREAVNIALNKGNRKNIAEKTKKQYLAYWFDFCSFLENDKVKYISEITEDHIIGYVDYIKEHGRYNNQSEYIRNGKIIKQKQTISNLSSHSVNRIIMFCSVIFDSVLRNSSFTINPFTTVDKVKHEKNTRDIFTEEEIKLILSSKDKDTSGLIVPLFRLAFYTGLRLGDLCNLEWNEIDFNSKMIKLKQNKTGNDVILPILDYEWLYNLYQHKTDDYVLPELQKMYSENKDGVTYRITKFLADVGICTTKIIQGKKVTVKDIHSCRHTFATICASQGISLTDVQNVLGHTSTAVTEIYTAHIQQSKLKSNFRKFSLLDNKQSRHGFPNVLVMAHALQDFAKLTKNDRVKIAHTILENLDTADVTTIFGLLGTKYIVQSDDNYVPEIDNTDSEAIETFSMLNPE